MELGEHARRWPTLDYLAPAEVKRLIAAGAVLPPTTSECLLPAEVAAAVPVGMVMMIGYGPEANFAEKPKAPKWTAKVRYKTTASLMRGMGGMMGAAGNGPDAGAAWTAAAEEEEAVRPRRPDRRGAALGGQLSASGTGGT